MWSQLFLFSLSPVWISCFNICKEKYFKYSQTCVPNCILIDAQQFQKPQFISSLSYRKFKHKKCTTYTKTQCVSKSTHGSKKYEIYHSSDMMVYFWKLGFVLHLLFKRYATFDELHQVVFKFGGSTVVFVCTIKWI